MLKRERWLLKLLTSSFPFFLRSFRFVSICSCNIFRTQPDSFYLALLSFLFPTCASSEFTAHLHGDESRLLCRILSEGILRSKRDSAKVRVRSWSMHKYFVHVRSRLFPNFTSLQLSTSPHLLCRCNILMQNILLLLLHKSYIKFRRYYFYQTWNNFNWSKKHQFITFKIWCFI